MQLADLPMDSAWFIVSPYIGQPTVRDGGAKTCFLSSRNAWKQAVATTVQKVKFLYRYQVWPECSICDHSLGLEEYVPASNHFDCLSAKLSGAQSNQAVADQFWQVCQVPGGVIRFTHVHGRVQL